MNKLGANPQGYTFSLCFHGMCVVTPNTAISVWVVILEIYCEVFDAVALQNQTNKHFRLQRLKLTTSWSMLLFTFGSKVNFYNVCFTLFEIRTHLLQIQSFEFSFHLSNSSIISERNSILSHQQCTIQLDFDWNGNFKQNESRTGGRLWRISDNLVLTKPINSWLTTVRCSKSSKKAIQK